MIAIKKRERKVTKGWLRDHEPTSTKYFCYFHGCERDKTEVDALSPYLYMADLSTLYCSVTELYRACE